VLRESLKILESRASGNQASMGKMLRPKFTKSLHGYLGENANILGSVTSFNYL